MIRVMLFLSLILAACFAHAERVRYVRAFYDIRTLGSALELYRSDTGVYPDEEIGLSALLSEVGPANGSASKGYLKRVSKDPWGFDYEYRYPGKHNTDSYDLWSNGADGKVGGFGFDADCGNWEESRKLCEEGHQVRSDLSENLKYAGIFGVFGAIIGLPLYIAGVVIRRKSDERTFFGYHLVVLVYLTLFGPIAVAIIKLVSG